MTVLTLLANSQCVCLKKYSTTLSFIEVWPSSKKLKKYINVAIRRKNTSHMIIIVIDDKIKYLSVYALLVQLLRKQQKYYINPQPI